MIAKSSARELASAELEEIQVLPADPGGATIVVRIKTANRGEVLVRGKVLANGDCTLSQPEAAESFGSIFDGQADKRLASAITRTIGARR